MKKLLIISIIILTSLLAKAQNDVHFSHYMFNYLAFNPAHAGSSNNIVASLVGRKQWVGMNQSPTTQLFNGHTYLQKAHGGVGATIINDKIGYESILSLRLHYAYHIKISDKATVAAGAGVGFITKSLNGSKLIFEETGDQGALLTQERQFKPDFNFGAELNAKNFSFGIASTHIDQSVNTASIFKVARHLYTYGKYNYRANEKVMIVPSVLVRSTLFVSQVEGSACVFYDNKVWGGASYRSKESIVGLVGFWINSQLKLGYSYDFNYGELRSQSSGSHEIMLTGTFKSLNKAKHHYKTPRFFN
jgi:type IX secretion system PorP/SprF family membrane protein